MGSYDYAIVKKGTLAIGYQIESYTYEGEAPKYSWRAGDGEESDMWFETAEEAEEDMRSRYGA